MATSYEDNADTRKDGECYEQSSHVFAEQKPGQEDDEQRFDRDQQRSIACRRVGEAKDQQGCGQARCKDAHQCQAEYMPIEWRQWDAEDRDRYPK